MPEASNDVIAETSSVCVCVRLGVVSRGIHSDASLKNLEIIMQHADAFSSTLQFLLTGDEMIAYPKIVAAICDKGYPIDITLMEEHLGHDNGEIEENIAKEESIFQSRKISWWGVHIPTSSIPPKLIDVCMDKGVRWLAFQMSKIAEGFPSPLMLASDLVGIPAVSKHLTDRKVNLDESRQIETLMHEVDALGVPLIFDFNLLAENAVDEIFAVIKTAQKYNLPLVSLNDISDVTLAKCKAVGDAKNRASMTQHLRYQRYWNENIGPTQQAYKVYDYRGGWRLKPGNYRAAKEGWEILSEPDLEEGTQINRHGFRGANFKRKKRVGQKRIIVIGDSVVFGIAGESAPWPAQVEICLDELMGEGMCQVINAGIEGQSSVHSLMRLDRILTYSPDVVLIAVGANDLFLNEPNEYWDTSGLAYATSWEVTGEYPLDSNYIRSIGGFCRNMELSKFYPFSYEDHIMRIVNSCQSAGTIPVISSLPNLVPADVTYLKNEHYKLMHHPQFVMKNDIFTMRTLYNAYNDASRIAAKRSGAVYIDVEGYFSKQFDDQRQNLFTDTCHTNRRGNVIIGRFIAENLFERVLE